MKLDGNAVFVAGVDRVLGACALAVPERDHVARADRRVEHLEVAEDSRPLAAPEPVGLEHLLLEAEGAGVDAGVAVDAASAAVTDLRAAGEAGESLPDQRRLVPGATAADEDDAHFGSCPISRKSRPSIIWTASRIWWEIRVACLRQRTTSTFLLPCQLWT